MNSLTDVTIDALLVTAIATVDNLLIEDKELRLPPVQGLHLDVGTGTTITANRAGQFGRDPSSR